MSPDSSNALASRRLRPLGTIRQLRIAEDIWTRSMEELAAWGRRRWEGLVLLAGFPGLDGTAYATTCLIPRRGHWGGGVRLQAEELASLTKSLVENDLHLLAQIHSHPGDFGHSAGDERFAACYRIGFFSFVVPDFAEKTNLRPEDCYVYEYEGEWRWRELPREVVEERVRLEAAAVGF